MSKRMDLYYALKIPTSLIVESDYEINTSFQHLRKTGCVISLGDSQLLRFIRNIRGTSTNPQKVKELTKQRNNLKEKTKDKKWSKEINELQSEIDELLYVPDVLVLKVDTSRKDYKYICRNGFTINLTLNGKQFKKKYVRLCAGAGQLRRNSAMFCSQDIHDQLEITMMCGLSRKRIGRMNLAKFGAYFALLTSATNRVTTPRICVVSDYEYILPDQDIDWIYTNEDGELDIEERKMDFNVNAFDGSGMISPAMAKKWQDDLLLDYTPSSFILRAPWCKGLVSVFDFHKFADEVAKTSEIIDIWGYKHDIKDIDIILTKSQFKMAKFYKSWDEYMYFFEKYEHIFSVARVDKKESNYLSRLNYQYIQSNFFTEESVRELAKPTYDWLENVINGNDFYTYSFMIGCTSGDKTAQEIEESLDSPIAKCMMYNKGILKDKYVRDKIAQMIDKKVQQAKVGKVFVEGSYDFIIPDLYAMAEHAFGMEVHGLIPAKHLYSKRWVDKGSSVVSIQRSPLVASAENQIENVYNDERCQEWFKYIKHGNILSIFDLTVISMSDAD